MSLYKRAGSKEWSYDFIIKSQRYTGETGKTARKAAQAVEDDRKAAIRAAMAQTVDGLPPEPARKVPTLNEAADDWWVHHGRALGRPEDEAFRLARLQQAVTLVGPDRRVTKITTADIAAAMKARREKLVRRGKSAKPPENATVNRDIIVTVRPIINHACALLDVSPPPIKWGALTLPEPKPRPRDYAESDMETFYGLLPAHWQDFARFAAKYGLRVREMFFHPDCILVQQDGVRVRLEDRKADDEHTIWLAPDDARMMLARKSRAEAAGIETVWFRQLKGWSYNAPAQPRIKGLTRDGAIWAVRKAIREAGLRGGKGTHDLRHHAAMTMLRTCKDIRTVQKLLGHSDIKSTMVYAHAMDDSLRDAIMAVSRVSPAKWNEGSENVAATGG